MQSKIKRDHDWLIAPIRITYAMRRAMLHHSKKIPGCPRPEEGSISHFAQEAILDKLLECGFDLRKLEPKIYDKSMS